MLFQILSRHSRNLTRNLTLESLGQEDYTTKSSLGYVVRSCLLINQSKIIRYLEPPSLIPYLKTILSFLQTRPDSLWNSEFRQMPSQSSAAFCFHVWIRHLLPPHKRVSVSIFKEPRKTFGAKAPALPTMSKHLTSVAFVRKVGQGLDQTKFW